MPGYELIDSEELNEIESIFDNGSVLFRHGFDSIRGCYKVLDFEKEFCAAIGCPNALAVSSGTAALRVALAAFGIGPGDEVIIPAFTFVATAEAVIESGAAPVCVNIDETLNMDPFALDSAITTATKAIIVVHMLGTPSRLREIKTIADENNLILIEDAAWGCGGSLDGLSLGCWGDAGCFSFDYAKTMTTGEGGMVVFRDEVYFKKAAAWHDHGHENNPTVPRWEDTRTSSGFNFRMSELQGAVGLAQLRKLAKIVSLQKKNSDRLLEALSSISGVEFRKVPRGSMETYDAFVFFMPDPAQAIRCRDLLVEAGVNTKILPEAISWHFAGSWDHMANLRGAGGQSLRDSLEYSEILLSRSVSIPMSVAMNAELPDIVREAVLESLL